MGLFDGFSSGLTSMAPYMQMSLLKDKVEESKAKKEAQQEYSKVLSDYADTQNQKQMQNGVDSTLESIGEAPKEDIGTMATKQNAEVNSLDDQIKLYTDLAKAASSKGRATEAIGFHDEINNLKSQFADQKIKALSMNKQINETWGGLASSFLSDPSSENWVSSAKQAMNMGLPGAEDMLKVTDPEQRIKIARAKQAQAVGAAKSIDQEIKLAKEEEAKRWHDILDANQDENRKLRESIAAAQRDLNEQKLAATRQRQIDELDIKRQRLELTKQKAEGKAKSDTEDFKVYDTLQEKLDDPEYGVYKTPPPAKEKTVARRITTDAKEVTSSVDQILKLTKGGMKGVTTGTFEDVKVKGFGSAAGKEFTNKITTDEEALYGAMLKPLAKAMAMYQNPDYRPNVNDVENAMNTYRASKGQTHEVQLEKFAILKRNFVNEAESFLDSHILNPSQAHQVKEQIRAIEKAIPWEVGDVTEYVQSGAKGGKSFDQFLKSRGAGNKDTKVKTAEDFLKKKGL